MTAVGLGQQGSQAVGSGFEHCETENNRRKIVILPPPPPPPLVHKIFRYQKFSETPKCSPRKFFRHCETKKTLNG